MSASSVPEPKLSVPDPFAPPPAPVKLYSPGQIGVAAVLGTFTTGAILYAVNQRRLGQRGGAIVTLVLGVAVLALLIALSFALPERGDVLISRLAHVAGVALYYVAKTKQQVAYQAALAAGGRRASNWAVFGIIVASFAVLFALAVVSGLGVPEEPARE